ncbi:SusC/RagA family TonB-linked outer membrane protein [Thalassobellus suaedae]|uniref:TonB-dependent receptor n=1 Tax=Thalassobellus suaedae TaxID=3074124 RepID=A0ABY9Y048_9FLAO|nr:TonB-dependent receptor [Flavobacteriaceae bacterium HL-DH10]
MEIKLKNVLSFFRKKLLIIIMRTFIFLCCITAFSFTPSNVLSQNSKVKIEVTNSLTVDEVFDLIMEQTDYKFIYQEGVFKNLPRIEVKKGVISANKLLKKSLSSGNFNIELSSDNTILVEEIKTVITEVQGIQISGTITDANNQPLPGANIIEKNTTNGTQTDFDGNFSLLVKDENAILVVSYLGFITQEITVNNQTTIAVVLIDDAASLDEVVVVGYGTQSKRNVTGSVATVDAISLSEMPAAQLTQKLQGQISGVQINQQSGTPGQGMSVRIRGQASILANSDPLYVVDGFPITSDINAINPDEIETITVLKDASATSLYGSRGANGVVLITTKGAKLGQSRFSVNVYTGFQTVPQRSRPDLMNATEFAQFKKESFEAKGLAVPTEFQNPEQYGEGSDWYGALLNDAAPIQNYNVSYSKRDEKHSVSVIGTYFNQDGVVQNSGYKKYSLRTNTSFNITDWLTLGVNVAPSYTVESRLNTDGLFFGSGDQILAGAIQAWPTNPIRDADGTLSATANTAFNAPNWLYTINNIDRDYKTTTLLSNAYIEAEIIEGLKVKTTINAEFGQTINKNFTPSHVSTSWIAAPPRTAISQNNNLNYFSWLNENTATYNKTLADKHNFELLAGFSSQKYRFEATNIQASNFPDDRISTIQSAVNIDRGSTVNQIEEWSLLSFFTRLNYNYAGKYLFSASFRTDGSSRFGPENRWGNFPSLSAGWIVSDEDFMENFDTVSFLKLKASYGVTGNNNIGNYTHIQNVSITDAAIFGSTVASGGALTGVGNPNLGWERTTQTNLGFEIGFLKNRIQLSYDYYLKKTTDLLFNLDVPRESGFSSITSNVGELKFWGHEIGVKANVLNGDFVWNANFNIAASDNRVEALSGLTDRLYFDDFGRGTTITKVGGRIGQFYGLIQDGVYVNQADYDNSPKHIRSGVGSIKFRDVNGDGVITEGGDNDDRTIIGNPFPDFIFGFTNNFSYKNFDLAIVMAGSVGNDINRRSDEGTTNLDGVFNVLKEVKYRWRSESDPGAGKYGRTDGDTGLDRGPDHSRYIHDGSYLAVKNLTLGYNMPLKETSAFSSVRLYSSIQQLLVISGYAGNPEVSTRAGSNNATALSQGIDFSAYPVPRTVTFGINLTLK